MGFNSGFKGLIFYNTSVRTSQLAMWPYLSSYTPTFPGAKPQIWSKPPHFLVSQYTSTHARTPLEEWSASCRGRCQHNRQQTPRDGQAWPSTEFESATPAIKRMLAYALDLTATGIGASSLQVQVFSLSLCCQTLCSVLLPNTVQFTAYPNLSYKCKTYAADSSCCFLVTAVL